MDSQSITLKDARTHQISLPVHQAEEVADAIKWIAEDAADMDEEELDINKDVIAAYHSIIKQLKDVPEEQKLYNYPEPQGDPSY